MTEPGLFGGAVRRLEALRAIEDRFERRELLVEVGANLRARIAQGRERLDRVGVLRGVARGAEGDDVDEVDVIGAERDDHRIGLGGVVLRVQVAHAQPVAELRRAIQLAAVAAVEQEAVVVGRAGAGEGVQVGVESRRDQIAVCLQRLVAERVFARPRRVLRAADPVVRKPGVVRVAVVDALAGGDRVAEDHDRAGLGADFVPPPPVPLPPQAASASSAAAVNTAARRDIEFRPCPLGRLAVKPPTVLVVIRRGGRSRSFTTELTEKSEASPPRGHSPATPLRSADTRP